MVKRELNKSIMIKRTENSTFCNQCAEAYAESCEASKMECFAKKMNSCPISNVPVLYRHNDYNCALVTSKEYPHQRHMQNPVKHLRWSVLSK